jgi:uncharacterized membrane protein YfhO
MDRRIFLRSGLCWTALAVAAPALLRAEDTVKVTVIAILASDKHKEVDKRLVAFAEEVQKKNPNLTGFRVDRTTTETLTLGVTKTFRLTDDQTADLTANSSQTEAGKIIMTIKPPKNDQITYKCVCDRFFSMATQYVNKDKEQLFIAVTGKISPAAVKEPEAPKTPPKSK